MSSHFDNSFYPFECKICGSGFHKVLRVLVNSNEVRCPRCHTLTDIQASKCAGDIGRALVRATELDKWSIATNSQAVESWVERRPLLTMKLRLQ
jgi:hypothetical protein